jgi:mannonate dehydratase
MSGNLTRRNIMQAAGIAAISATAATAQKPKRQLRAEGEDTPKICQQVGALRYSAGDFTEAGMRRVKQLGVDYVLTDVVRAPWDETVLKEAMARFKAAGLTLRHMYLGGYQNATYGRPGRDQEIEGVIRNIKVAGKAGVPVLEYNWYAHRAQEGYYGETARGGSGITSFDADRVKDLPPLAQVGVHTVEQMWANITYFLKAVIPEAEKAGVRLALHPNDPPVILSRGSGQIVNGFEGWKRLIKVVDSPSNGITFDCGVTAETGADPVEVCRYFGSRDRINHVHFRNVIVKVPREKYSEVALDAGEVDMFGVMKELVKNKYKHLIHPEHPRALDYDTQQPGFSAQYPGGGGYAAWAFNVAYTRAMLQAALNS